MNDVHLSAYLNASDELSRGQELERLLTDEVQPKAQAVLDGYLRSDWPLAPQDLEDLRGHITLRVLRKLRAAMVFEEESVQNLEAYVVTLTRNAVRDFMRRRSPERTRMKSRLRYLFTRDDRLAYWVNDNVTLCGLAEWRTQTNYETQLSLIRDHMSRVMENPGEAADAITSALVKIGSPVRLGDLVNAVVPEPLSVERMPALEAMPQTDPVEARQYLQILWREIRDLPQRQQTALLLNLREPGSGNAVILFLVVGIATIDEIAAAVGMTRGGLADIWDQLPFDDLRIAEQLAVNRQQVINLRKSARERLKRRMSLRGGGAQ